MEALLTDWLDANRMGGSSMKWIFIVGLLLFTACAAQSYDDAAAERLAFCKEKGWQREFYAPSLIAGCCKTTKQFMCVNDSILYPDGGVQQSEQIDCKNSNMWRCYWGSVDE